MRTFDYDALNRLVAMRRDGALMARYAYDVLGRRIAKRVYSSASNGVPGYTRFVYHGDHVAFQADSAGAMGLRFTWGLGTDDLRALQDAAGQNYYVVQDKLGSTRGLFQRDGTWRLSVRYTPYGAGFALDSAGPKPPVWYGWTGREFDEETGWYYHRARYYSPLVRRFVQEDPIGYEGGTNLYAYVEGRALEATDPTGTKMQEDDRRPTGGLTGGPDDGYPIPTIEVIHRRPPPNPWELGSGFGLVLFRGRLAKLWAGATRRVAVQAVQCIDLRHPHHQ